MYEDWDKERIAQYFDTTELHKQLNELNQAEKNKLITSVNSKKNHIIKNREKRILPPEV